MTKEYQPQIRIVDESNPPESRLAVLRAKQLLGIHNPKEYEKTRQEVINGLHPKTRKLWLKLEKEYDCEVCELIYEGQGIYGFKIRTPKGTFLDYGEQKEIIDFFNKLGIKIIGD